MPGKNFAAIMAILLLVLLLVHLATSNATPLEKISFKPTFTGYVNQGNISKVTVINDGMGSTYLEAELKDVDANGNPRSFRVDVQMSDGLSDWLRESEIPVLEFERKSTMVRDILWGTIPFLMVMVLLYFLFIRQMRAAGKGAMSFGKSRAKMLTRDRNKITFKNVAGVNEAKEEVEEIIEFLRDPKKFQKLGGRIPKGVMLSGPPGTGKTLLAKAIAGEANVPFFSISGSDFVEMFVGVGASRVRDMFEQGRRHAPCIIFIDEIDAVGRSRFSGMGGGHDEREQTLNALLVEMDGFDTQEGVIIIAATNRPDVLDNALLRPGRFDRQIVVDLPTLEGRIEILKIHSKNVRVDAEVDLSVIARGTPGFSGADLANLVNEAALLAARRGVEAVAMPDMEEARDKVCFGRERRSRVMGDEEKEMTAYHEAGHAIVMAELEHADPVHKVTIIPRGSSLGSTMWLPEKEEFTQGKKKLLSQLVVSMGGRAAEAIALDDISNGAVGDIEHATRIAHAMVCRFGMNDELGPQAFGNNEEHLWMGREINRSQSVSEATAQRIDAEMSKLIKDSYDEAVAILERKRTELDTMAKILLEQETINGRDVADIVNFNRIRTAEERGDPPPPETPNAAATLESEATESGTPATEDNVENSGGPAHEAPPSPA